MFKWLFWLVVMLLVALVATALCAVYTTKGRELAAKVLYRAARVKEATE